MSHRPDPSSRTRRTLLGLAALPLAIGHGLASAQAWPNKGIKLVLPSGAGGGSDLFGRPLAEYMSQQLKVPVVVENRPGANGILAHETVVRQPADGYSLVISYPAAVIGNKLTQAKMSHDPLTDLQPIGRIGGGGGNTLIVNADVPVRNLKELVEWVRGKGGEVSYASWGIASGGHFIMEMLKHKLGMKLNHVPYKTVAQIPPDIISGVVPMAWIDSATPVTHVKAGRVRPIAVAAQRRLPQFPDAAPERTGRAIRSRNLVRAVCADWPAPRCPGAFEHGAQPVDPAARDSGLLRAEAECAGAHPHHARAIRAGTAARSRGLETPDRRLQDRPLSPKRSPVIPAQEIRAMTTPAAIDFSRLFGARSIAVIGASADEKTPSGQPLMHLRNLGYPGEVYPVNPRYEVIGQWRCYPSVSALPAAPDVALVAVAAERAPAVLEECGNKGIRFVIMITSGFAEMGEAGMAAQARLLETARRHGISMIGPNCQGMINAADGFSLGFGAPYGLRYNRGGISMTSQSGAWGNAVMILANQEGLGFRHYVSTGNEAQTTSLDLVDWYLDDPQTRLVVSYVEGFQDAHRLVSIGRKALELGKPYLLWKVGTSEAGARAAASHTANLGGEMALYRAAFEQSGIIEVTDVDDLADRAHALLTGRRPGGNRVAVISMSGGAGVLMADHCAAAGLELPTLSPDTLERLRAILPAFAGLNNPIDVTGNVSAREGSFVEALELILADPLVDMLGICLASISGPAGNQIAIDVARVCAATTKPVLVAWCADVERTREGYEALAAVGTPRYDTPVRCARGMDALWHFERARRDHERISAEPGAAPGAPGAAPGPGGPAGRPHRVSGQAGAGRLWHSGHERSAGHHGRTGGGPGRADRLSGGDEDRLADDS